MISLPAQPIVPAASLRLIQLICAASTFRLISLIPSPKISVGPAQFLAICRPFVCPFINTQEKTQLTSESPFIARVHL